MYMQYANVYRYLFALEFLYQRKHTVDLLGLDVLSAEKSWAFGIEGDIILCFPKEMIELAHREENSEDKYEVNLGESFKKLDNIEDGKMQSCIRNFCLNLLTQETYNPRVLKKFGFA